MFKVYTRREKLERNITSELGVNNQHIDKILEYVFDYEKSNLETIEKLKRKKNLEIKKINGALKQTINAHGPITKELISSASKRIYGGLLETKKDNILKRIKKWIGKILIRVV